MPLSLPNLDDRTYTDLVEEARALIPTFAPGWTNHNPSDPGITLIELFAYLTEMLIYRLNRLSDAKKLAFLKLLNGSEWKVAPDRSIAEQIRETVLTLRRPERAVSLDDFERLACESDARVERVRAIPWRDLESEDPSRPPVEKPGHISVIVVPYATAGETAPQPSAELIARVGEYLEPRRLLTTQVQVVGPRYFPVGVRVGLVLESDAKPADVLLRATTALRTFLMRGQAGTGWPFGRNVYASEIYELLDKLPGVDFVQDPPGVELTVDAGAEGRLVRNSLGEVTAVEIKPEELVAPHLNPADITAT